MKPSEIWKNKQYKNKDKFGIYVKNRRKELGLTIKDFAEKLNLSPAYICDIENGKRLAPLGCLDKIVSTLKIEENEVN
ncbi:MAG: helix-turn-helix domain-containing protein, partial [Clostridia bacterium]|nr:helix-turn-helix domain-containing protein [Clostridia bacterium]